MKPELNDEQQFAIVCFNYQVDNMSETQSKQLLKHLYEQMLIQRIGYTALLKHEWGI